jgi:DNA-directed RNA polymerase subunit RPC12/RpoP
MVYVGDTYLCMRCGKRFDVTYVAKQWIETYRRERRVRKQAKLAVLVIGVSFCISIAVIVLAMLGVLD